MNNSNEPWQDGCVFNPHGVVCKDKTKECERCGWFPAEAKRRKLERSGREKGGRET